MYHHELTTEEISVNVRKLNQDLSARQSFDYFLKPTLVLYKDYQMQINNKNTSFLER